jgi:hypothetical protein
MFVQSDTASSGSNKWWVGFNLSGNTGEVKEKLQGKAKGTGLYGGSSASGTPASLGESGLYSVGKASVWMVAR